MDRDLIEVARLLASQQPGVPQQASLRRAVSTAYYAVFHALAARCASTLVTYRGSDWDTYTLVYRAIDHQTARRTFEARDVGSTFGLEVAAVAGVFVTLQQARIQADYFPQTFPFGRVQIVEMVDQARNACELIDRIPAKRMRRLAAQLVVRRR